MKIAKRDKQIMLIFLGIILAVAAFYLVFLPGKEKAEALITENQGLALRVTELTQLASKQEQFESEIRSMTEEINGIYADFQTDFRSEDAFMLGKTVEEKADNTMITAITVGDLEVVYDPLSMGEGSTAGASAAQTDPAVAGTDGTSDASGSEAQTVRSAADQVELPRPVLYQKAISLTHSCTAQGLKDIIDYITLNTNKMTIESLSVSYDMTTGVLNGNTAVNVYLLQGTNKPYTPWSIPNVQTGTDNIFGTLVLPSNVSADEEEDNMEEANTEEAETEAGGGEGNGQGKTTQN